MIAISIRCPSIASSSSTAMIDRKLPITGLDAPLCGSAIEAKPRPIALLISSPATNAAE